MLDVMIDENEARELYMEKVEEKLKQFDVEFVFWDTKELQRRTCMSWNTIQKEFFFDPRFPKFQTSGGHWRFPASEAKKFLLEWAAEKTRIKRK